MLGILREIGLAYKQTLMTPLAIWCAGFFFAVWMIGYIRGGRWSLIISRGDKKGMVDFWTPLIAVAGIGLMVFGTIVAWIIGMNILYKLYALILTIATIGGVVATLRFKADFPRSIRNAFGLAVFAMGFGPLIDSLLLFRFPWRPGIGIPVALLVIIVNLGVGSLIMWKNDAAEHVTWAIEQLRGDTPPAKGDTGSQVPS